MARLLTFERGGQSGCKKADRLRVRLSGLRSAEAMDIHSWSQHFIVNQIIFSEGSQDNSINIIDDSGLGITKGTSSNFLDIINSSKKNEILSAHSRYQSPQLIQEEVSMEAFCCAYGAATAGEDEVACGTHVRTSGLAFCLWSSEWVAGFFPCLRDVLRS